jgi:YHS domain-containing protein
MCTNHNHDEATDKQDAAPAHDDTHTHSHSHSHDAAKPDQDPSDLAECPVMPGTMVLKSEADDDEMYRDYNGTRIYLCCDACLTVFDADPARYANAT